MMCDAFYIIMQMQHESFITQPCICPYRHFAHFRMMTRNTFKFWELPVIPSQTQKKPKHSAVPISLPDISLTRTAKRDFPDEDWNFYVK